MRRSKMSVGQRAKIFMPFDALKGFKEAIKEKEKIKVEQKSLSDDQKEVINNTLTSLSNGDLIKIVYYDYKEKNYLSLTGILTEINDTLHYLKIVKTKIDIESIIAITCIEENLL